MWRQQFSRTVVIGTAVVVFIVCCVAPVFYLLFTSLASAETAYAAVLLDARQRGLLYNTALLGTATAVVASAIGIPLGIALARVPLRRKQAIRLALAAPALVPPYVAALAWVYVGSNRDLVQAIIGRDLLSEWTYSLPASVGVLSLVLYPLSMLTTEVALRRIDGRLEEAALMVAPPHRVLGRITLPLAAPSILAAALVIFVLAVSEFGVPGLLRVRVYTTEVFTAFAALYDFSRATLLSLPLLVLSAAVASGAAALFGERLVTTRRHTRVLSPLLHARKRLAAIAIIVVIVLALGVPISILVREAAGTPLGTALGNSSQAILNSLMLSSAGATVIVAVSIWLGYAGARARRRIGQIADVTLVVLFAVPSTIVGVGLIGVWNRPGLIGIPYGTDAMFLLAYLARFVPVAALILAASVRYVPVSHEEAAAVSGAGWLRTLGRIVVPQIWLGVATAWVITFVLAFGELGVSILVAPPGEATLPIRIYTMIANAPSSQVASLALLQTVVIFTPLAILGTAIAVRKAD
jgi:iron(III) transport system permease protein